MISLLQLPSKVLTPFGKIKVEQTPTFTGTVKLEDTARGLDREPFAWEWRLVIVQDSEKVLTPTPGTSLSRES